MKNFGVLFLFPLLFSLWCGSSVAEPSYIFFPSDIPWKQKESEHFKAIFSEGQSRLGDRALVAAEKAFKLLTPIFPEFPEKTWIVLSSFQDSTNGYALNFPFPHIVIFACPPEAGAQLSELDSWFESIIFHEYTHILHLYPAHGLWKLMRTIFGSIIVPNGLLPSHFHEGMATLMETEFSKGGRGRGATFGMFKRKAVESGTWGNEFVPLDLLEGSQTRWPQGISPYFFGYTLHKELWERKNKQGIWDLTLSYSSNWPYLFLNGPLKEVYGVGYTELWKQIFDKTEKEARTEIAEIKKQPVSKLSYLTDSKFFKWDVTFSPDAKKVLTRRHSPFQNNDFLLMSLADRKILKTIPKGSGDTEGTCWVKWEGKEFLLYETNVSENGYSTKYLAQLDLEKEEEFIYSQDSKLGHLHKIACNPSESMILAYQEVGGIGFIRELKLNLKQHTIEKAREWKIPEGTWVTSFLADEQAYFTLRAGMSTELYEWKESSEPRRLMTFPYHVFNLKLGKESSSLLAITNKDQRNEVYEISLPKKSIRKKIAVVGGLNAFDYLDNQFIVSSYEHGGYDIATAETANFPFEKVRTEEKPRTVSATAESVQSDETTYSPWHTLLPHTWVPSVLIVPDGIQFGAWIPGFDLSQKHAYDIYAGYDTRGLPYASVGYNYRFAKHFTVDVNAMYLPSYIQSVRTFMKRWGGSAGVSANFKKLPRIRLAALYRKLEENPTPSAFQSVGFEIDLSENWGFSNRPLSISPVNGANAYLNYAYFPKSLASTESYFTAVAGLNLYAENPLWKDSVFYLGTKAGYTEGSTLFNSYFEGGGELLFSQGRNLFMNRGYLSGTFVGRRILTSNFEYRFPIARIDRGIWLLPVHLQRIHAALTYDILTTDLGAQTSVERNFMKSFFSSVGFELKTDWRFGYYLPTQIRLGVYHAIDPVVNRFGEHFDQTLQFVFGLEASL